MTGTCYVLASNRTISLSLSPTTRIKQPQNAFAFDSDELLKLNWGILDPFQSFGTPLRP
jgi:hypothetical protein